jgi:hypothetical protein
VLANAAEAKADPPKTENRNVQVIVELRCISVSPPLAKMIITHPALDWTSLLPLEPADAAKLLPLESADATKLYVVKGNEQQITPGTVRSAVQTESAIVVRLLEESNFDTFTSIVQLNRSNRFVEMPKIMLHNGQKGMINDTTAIPFVVGICPIEGDEGVDYQPVIRHVNQGITFTVRGTVLQDDSCRLDECCVDYTTLIRTELAQWREEEEPRGKTQERSGLTVQVPVVHSFRVNIPEIVVPSGMSLLVAFPGVEGFVGTKFTTGNKEDGTGDFLLITPRAVHAPR